uniref:Uncharacterized protein n=1 Tax=Timema bartmani TaxID=61472 RepID=A0A7R9ES80_9NEOP|nr:unnamed protein product [Timema bartmani]
MDRYCPPLIGGNSQSQGYIKLEGAVPFDCEELLQTGQNSNPSPEIQKVLLFLILSHSSSNQTLEYFFSFIPCVSLPHLDDYIRIARNGCLMVRRVILMLEWIAGDGEIKVQILVSKGPIFPRYNSSEREVCSALLLGCHSRALSHYSQLRRAPGALQPSSSPIFSLSSKKEWGRSETQQRRFLHDGGPIPFKPVSRVTQSLDESVHDAADYRFRQSSRIKQRARRDILRLYASIEQGLQTTPSRPLLETTDPESCCTHGRECLKATFSERVLPTLVSGPMAYWSGHLATNLRVPGSIPGWCLGYFTLKRNYPNGRQGLIKSFAPACPMTQPRNTNKNRWLRHPGIVEMNK